MTEHLFLCGGVRLPTSISEPARRLSWHGNSPNVRLRIQDISRRLVANIPDVLVDLLEVASYVYAADGAIGRGGLIDEQMGARWRRKLRFVIPVRCPDTWTSDRILTALVDTLGFLSEDDYEFEFRSFAGPPPSIEDCFEFPREDKASFSPDEIILFSGGLDSLAGVVEALARISHHGGCIG